MSGGIPPDDDELSGDDDFRAVFGEGLDAALDINTWSTGIDLASVMARFRREIAGAVERESSLRTVIRDKVLPQLADLPGGPAEVGVYKALPDELETIHHGLLFSGRTEAVNATSASHDSLPIGITQIGIAAVGYRGTSGTFSQRLFRREVSAQSTDPVAEAIACINRRQKRSFGGRKDALSKLARRGIKAYAERAVLVDKSEAEWRMGHGNPFAYELLSGSGYLSLLQESLALLRRLVTHKKFVFVPSALEDRGYLTIGYALNAGEYAIFESLERYGDQVIDNWQYGGRSKNLARSFVKECCPDILVGVFRTSESSAPRFFYAHREYAHLAARVALADSILRPERGFPMLLDVAESSCRSAFGEDGFLGLVHDAYAQAGASLQYFNERGKRR